MQSQILTLPPSRKNKNGRAEFVPAWYYNYTKTNLNRTAKIIEDAHKAHKLRRALPSTPTLPNTPRTKAKASVKKITPNNLALSETLAMLQKRQGLKQSHSLPLLLSPIPNTYPSVPQSLPSVPQSLPPKPKPSPKNNTLPNVPSIHPFEGMMSQKIKNLIKSPIYKFSTARHNENHIRAFGRDLCGWTKSYSYKELKMRIQIMMPKAGINNIIIDKDGTSTDSFIRYNLCAEELKISQSKNYMITFVSDNCTQHMSVIFHVFHPDRIFYFNTAFQPELHDFLEYATGRKLVFLDYYNIQINLEKSTMKDEFCILHSTAFAYELYKHFEESRPLGSLINNKLNNVLFQVTYNPKQSQHKKLSYENNIQPIYEKYATTIISKNKTPLPTLAEFLLKLQKVTKKHINNFVKTQTFPNPNTNMRKSYLSYLVKNEQL